MAPSILNFGRGSHIPPPILPLKIHKECDPPPTAIFGKDIPTNWYN
jgi:hypothetical protein